MGSKGGKKRAQADHYSLRAKKEGYPARSVYKLEEIQKKYQIFTPGGKILDIGASPGSWTLYCLRNIGRKGEIAAIDLKPLTIKEDPRLFFLQGDAFSEENRVHLQNRGPYDTVISDAAPATTGNRTVDTGRSFSMAESILHEARRYLSPGGNLVIKIFQGGDERELLKRTEALFSKARLFKPKACRSESFETYLIGTGFTGSPASEQP